MQNQATFFVLGLIAIFLNSCIVVLHFHPKKTNRNSYDRLILIFAVLDIVFAVLHSALLPVFLYQNSTAAFLSVGVFCCFSFSQVLLNFLYIIYLSFIVLVTHSFVYRFAYLCKSPILPYLQRFEYEVFVCICPFIIAAPFMVVGNLQFGPRHSLSQVIEPALVEYEVDVYSASYFAKAFGHGQETIYGIIIFAELLIISTGVVVTCTWCTLLITRRLNKHILSHRARRMHRRMLKLLVCQSLLPVVTLYAPVIFFFLSLFFDHPVSSNASFVLALLFSLFPSIDALLVSFFVRDYRPFAAKKEQSRRASTKFAAAVTLAMTMRSMSIAVPAEHNFTP